MPRAGGDYVWQTRILGGGIGFVMAATGWWFILSHSGPDLRQHPRGRGHPADAHAILGFTGTSAFHADWWPYSASDGNGIFFTSILTASWRESMIQSPGDTRDRYAKIQKYCFYGGMVGLVLMILIFLTHSHQDFHQRLQHVRPQDLYGVQGDGLPADGRRRRWLHHAGPGSFPVKETFLLLPFIVFYNLWPNWGATLYGEGPEVRVTSPRTSTRWAGRSSS